MLSLDLALITHKPDGMLKIAKQNLPRVAGVRYIVSWQAHGDVPIPDEVACRDDIEVHRYDGVGLSNNRNNAIEHCRADIILLADNDVTYTAERLLDVINTFESNPEVDIATFRSQHGDMSRFPSKPATLHKKFPKGYYVSSIELSLRRHSAGHLRLCPELGLGAPRFKSGEEEMMLMSAIRRGLNCKFFPITICDHPDESTGSKSRLAKGTLLASGCTIALTKPFTAPLRLPLKAWRVWRAGQASFFPALRFLLEGALAAPALLRRNRDYLW